MTGYGIIVDGYSTGSGFAKEFLKYNIPCIHVQTQPKIPEVYSHTYTPDNYQAHYIFDNNLNWLIGQLKKYKLRFVIAGAECGVELADILSEHLDLPGNGSQLSEQRRNKYFMQERIKSRGLQSIPSFRAATLEDALNWSIKQNKWPLIVKPLNSAGGEGVRICNNLNEVRAAYHNIMSTKINMLGFQNDAVIVQHYIQGEEYVVNTASYAGQYKFCELWYYTRQKREDGQQIYDTARVIDVTTRKHEEVINYALQVIDILGIQYGPAHVEIIKNDQGCYLIEMGARLMGANLPFSLLANCITTAQSFFTTLAYASPAQFKEKFFLPYQVTRPLAALFMISNQIGTIKAINYLNEIRSLQSFYDMKFAVKEGGTLEKTIDYQTSPGMIYLSHHDSSILEADIFRIRTLENNMFQLTKESVKEHGRVIPHESV